MERNSNPLTPCDLILNQDEVSPSTPREAAGGKIEMPKAFIKSHSYEQKFIF